MRVNGLPLSDKTVAVEWVVGFSCFWGGLSPATLADVPGGNGLFECEQVERARRYHRGA